MLILRISKIEGKVEEKTKKKEKKKKTMKRGQPYQTKNLVLFPLFFQTRFLHTHTHSNVTDDSVLTLSVWNWRKFSKKQSSGYMGSADIPLAFVFRPSHNPNQCSCARFLSFFFFFLRFPFYFPPADSKSSSGEGYNLVSERNAEEGGTVFLSFELLQV